MDPLLSWARENRSGLIGFIRELVECESPTDSPEAVARCANLLADSLSDIADARMLKNNTYVGTFRLAGGRKSGRPLALGHSDTVWPLGTLRTMKFRQRDGRLWG